MTWKTWCIVVALVSLIAAIVVFNRSNGTKQASPVQVSTSTTLESSSASADRPVRRSSRRTRLATIEDPLEVAAGAKQPDAAMTAWLQDWEDTWADGKVASEKEQHNLQLLLRETMLDPGTLLSVAHAFNTNFSNPEISSLFYAAAARRVNDVLNANSETNTLLLVQSINHHRQNFKDVLWPLIEKGDRTSLNTLTTFYSTLLSYAPPDNKKFDGVVQTVSTGLAECLFLQNRFDESLDLLEKNSSQKLSKERRSALDWASSLVLMREHRFREAIPHLESVANDQRFPYRTASIPVLIRAYCANGAPAEAETWYEKYLSDCHPGFSAAIDTATEIEFAKSKFQQ